MKTGSKRADKAIQVQIGLYKVKNLNKHAIIDLIRFTPGGISRVELARQLGLTRAAVTTIVNDLLEKNIICEDERKSAGGRTPIVLEINPKRGRVVGVDIGATHANIILADYSARVIRDYELPLRIGDGPEVCLQKVDEGLRELLAKESLQLSDISAVGVGVPGPVVVEVGLVSAPPIMPGWDNFPIRDRLEELWGCPVTLNNDAELGALGEWAYGAARGESNIAYIKVGTGVGAGLLLGGQIYRGSTGSAGEIGHFTIDENGPRCSCGNRGCLEAMAGGYAISARAVQQIKAGHRTVLAEIEPITAITARDVISAARRGDLVAQQIVIDGGRHLGTAIASLFNLINPSIVNVGGGDAQIGDLLLEPIRQSVKARSLRVSSSAVRVTEALLGRRSSGMGAVVQALTIVLHELAEA